MYENICGLNDLTCWTWTLSPMFNTIVLLSEKFWPHGLFCCRSGLRLSTSTVSTSEYQWVLGASHQFRQRSWMSSASPWWCHPGAWPPVISLLSQTLPVNVSHLFYFLILYSHSVYPLTPPPPKPPPSPVPPTVLGLEAAIMQHIIALGHAAHRPSRAGAAARDRRRIWRECGSRNKNPVIANPSFSPRSHVMYSSRNVLCTFILCTG